jgi:cell wall-associated NlpC family hydrolase
MIKILRAACLVFALTLLRAALALPYELYQIQQGDTLEIVAAKFRVTTEEICRLNQKSPGCKLSAGESLAVPAPRQAEAAAYSGAAPRAPLYWLAVVKDGRAIIRRLPGRGGILYRPAPGSPLALVGERGDHYGVLMADGSNGWISKRSVTLQPVPLTLVPPSGQGSDVVREAFRYLGVPYRYGGSLPYNTDCSQFVQTVFLAFGLALPRTAAQQFLVGLPVSPQDLQPGDRLYFMGGKGNVNHTGIYIGDGLFIHASSMRGMVAVDSLATGYYWRRFVGARR